MPSSAAPSARFWSTSADLATTSSQTSVAAVGARAEIESGIQDPRPVTQVPGIVNPLPGLYPARFGSPLAGRDFHLDGRLPPRPTRRSIGGPTASILDLRPSVRHVTEPVALSSTQPDDLPLPRTASGLSFDLLALRARCVEEPMGARRLGQAAAHRIRRSLRSFWFSRVEHRDRYCATSTRSRAPPRTGRIYCDRVAPDDALTRVRT